MGNTQPGFSSLSRRKWWGRCAEEQGESCLVVGMVSPFPRIRELRLWVGAAWSGAFCHSVEEPPRDEITGRPKLELLQYVGDQENRGPATVRE